MPGCCSVFPGQPEPVLSPIKWATLSGGHLTHNRCPCIGGCKVELKPKPNWGGWSGSTKKETTFHIQSSTPPPAVDFNVDISCTSSYRLSVGSASLGCSGVSDVALAGNCDTVSGNTSWIPPSPSGCDCCGCFIGEPVGIFVTITASEPSLPPAKMPPPPNEDPPPTLPCECGCTCECEGEEEPSDSGAPGGGSGIDDDDSPLTFSLYPIRYATGELRYQATDIKSSGFGWPWGHSRSFCNRLTVSTNFGQGFNWLITQMPYLIKASQYEVVLMGNSTAPRWFDQSGSNIDLYLESFGGALQLRLDRSRRCFVLALLDGTQTEFDMVTGKFLRHIKSGGQVLAVTAWAASGTQIATVEQSYSSGANTVTEQFLYTYTQPNDRLLETVTLRRRVNAGDWANGMCQHL